MKLIIVHISQCFPYNQYPCNTQHFSAKVFSDAKSLKCNVDFNVLFLICCVDTGLTAEKQQQVDGWIAPQMTFIYDVAVTS